MKIRELQIKIKWEIVKAISYLKTGKKYKEKPDAWRAKAWPKRSEMVINNEDYDAPFRWMSYSQREREQY